MGKYANRLSERLRAGRTGNAFAFTDAGLRGVAPTKTPEKGLKAGNCNVTACQKPGAVYFNKSTRAYYCAHCAEEINWPGGRADTRSLYGTDYLCELDDEALALFKKNNPEYETLDDLLGIIALRDYRTMRAAETADV